MHYQKDHRGLKKYLHLFIIWANKKQVVASMRHNGFIVDDNISVSSLYNFFHKEYADGSASCCEI